VASPARRIRPLQRGICCLKEPRRGAGAQGNPWRTIPTNDDCSYAHDLIGCHPVVTQGVRRYRFQTPIALRASLPRKYPDPVFTQPAVHRMSTNSETPQGATAAEQLSPATRKNSYSRKRWSAFDAWQEHVRKSAGTTHASHVGVVLSQRHDRDLRRAVVTG